MSDRPRKATRVLMIYTSGIERTNAPATHFKELARGFSRLGLEVTIFAPLHAIRRPGDLPCRAILVPMMFRHPVLASLARLVMLLYFPFVLLLVRPHLIYERATFIGFILHPVAHLLGIKLGTELNGVVGQELTEGGLPAFVGELADRITVAKFKHSIRIVSVSQDIVDAYAGKHNLPPERFVVFHNGADTDKIQPKDKRKCRRALGLPEDEFIYGYIGGFAVWHRAHDIVRAVHKLKRQGRWRGKVMLVGLIPRARTTVRLIEQLDLGDEFLQFGWIGKDELPLYFGASDVGLGTFSKQKCAGGFSAVKVFEYLAAGLPVILSDTRQHREVIEANGLGYLFPAEDVDALAEAMVKVREAGPELAEMSARARRYMLKNGSWSVIAERIWRALEPEVWTARA